jgi:hypothetical protein
VSYVELFVSRDRGGVWEPVAQAKPDQKFISFMAKEDGLYWLNMVVVFKDGTQEPANVAAVPPAQKLLIDTTPPVLRIRDPRREGDEVSVEWSVEDAFPNDERTKVEYRLAGGSDLSWKAVPVTAADHRGTRFNPNSNLGVQVRITVEDQAGNATTQMVEAAGVSTGTVPTITGETTTMKPSIAPALVQPPTLPQVAPVEPGATGEVPMGPAPLVDLTPKPSPAPLAMGTGVPPVAAPLASSAPTTNTPALEMPAAQVINFVKFDLPYQIEAGPSGISRVDLYVTRDDGATWTKWSEHDGRESPLKVALDRRYNPQPEGTYGFRLLPVSGAGLSDTPPSRGTPPELRVQVDLTPPVIKIYQPEADANQRDVLVLKWEATDKNFGKEPIALEWSEGPSGPWKPVVGGDSLVPVAAGNSGGPVRIANTGSYGWKLPANLPTHKVYLKVTAWDLAGNKSEVATPSPILVDLVKPRARIQGIVPTATLVPR